MHSNGRRKWDYKQRYMSYHTAKFDDAGLRWTAGAAFSEDGIHWKKAQAVVSATSAGCIWMHLLTL